MREGSLRRQWEQEQTGLENVIQDLSREQGELGTSESASNTQG